MALINVGGYEEDIQELKTAIESLNREIKKRIGTIFYTADSTKFTDCLICDGSELNVSDYEELWGVIGYKYGGSDTVFNLPNLINRVPWGSSDIPGYLSAGLPNITGKYNATGLQRNDHFSEGCFKSGWEGGNPYVRCPQLSNNADEKTQIMIALDASLSNSIYGKSNTVQPPACKLTPMIWFR